MSELGLRIPIPPLDRVLREHHLDQAAEEPFPNDGWSGASLTRLRRGGGDRFILKRDSPRQDWIAQATRDGPVLREAWFAARARIFDQFFSEAIRAPYLGVGMDGDGFGLLMPDLTGVLFDWARSIAVDDLERVLAGLAALHAYPWAGRKGFSDVLGDPAFNGGGPWCPLRERVTLICRSSLEKAGPAREAVADRILPGWDAFDRAAPAAARDLMSMLGEDPRPLLGALAAQEHTLIHGDLKLANAGIAGDGVVEVVDWQMVSFAPIAVEIGWFLVANVASLPVPPDDVVRRYRAHLAKGFLDPDDGWVRDEGADFDEGGIDAAILVGLLLRGWRKGMDAEAGITLGSGVSAADDLAWWCERAVEAAGRIL